MAQGVGAPHAQRRALARGSAPADAPLHQNLTGQGIDGLTPAHPNPYNFHILLIRLPSWQVRENRQAPPMASVSVKNSGSSHA